MKAHTGIALLALVLAGQLYGQSLDAVRVTTGLTHVLYATAPPGDTHRLFLVRQSGRIHILNLDTGVLNSTLFLNMSGRVATSDEEGLLGLAFDPSYATNGKFYIDYVAPGGAYGHGVSRISQFRVSPTNRDVADGASEKVLLSFSQPEVNHNAGWIGFSPRANDDHNLYIAVGDGGAENDQGIGHIEPGGNAQNNTTVLGKILRIHVNPTTGAVTIPTTNPFYGFATLKQQIWVNGLRNPFRCSFDGATGRLFIGDVGQDSREEIDVQPAPASLIEKGNVITPSAPNYEWRLREGTIQTPASGVGGARPAGGIDPIYDYPHTTGQCITGGYVYRGNAIPALRGTYVFGDYLGPEGGSVGRVFAFNYDGSGRATNFRNITTQLFPTRVGNFGLKNPASFGEDASHELYICDYGNGAVYKIVPAQ